MSRSNVMAAAGTALVTAGVLQALGDTIWALDRVDPGDPGFAFANLTAASWHVVFLIGLTGVATQVRGTMGRLRLIGVVTAATGLALLVTSEIVTQVVAAIPIPLIAASAPITGIGAILFAVGLLRAGERGVGLAALVVGVYAVALIIPTSADGDANYFVIAGWGLCWAGLGVAALVRAGEPTDGAGHGPGSSAVEARAEGTIQPVAGP